MQPTRPGHWTKKLASFLSSRWRSVPGWKGRHAHTRRALEMGVSPEELKHAVALCVTTLGFPAAMVAYTRISDILED
jgi:hypothetical protein